MKSNYSELLAACTSLVGLESWSPVAGVGTGSSVTIGLGSPIARKKALENPALDETNRKFFSERSIFVESAAWRLDHRTGVLCSSKSPNYVGGDMLRGLRRLRGTTINSISLDKLGLDLEIYFSDEYRLTIFADCMSEDDDGDNYSIYDPAFIYSVMAGGLVVIESRRPL